MAAHKWAKEIKALADGMAVQYFDRDLGDWRDVSMPFWLLSTEYRIKPAEPERVYPVTQMTSLDLNEAYGQSIYMDLAIKQARKLCNAALRHAIDNGQVVTREEFDKLDAQYKETAELLRYTREKLQAALTISRASA